MLVSLTCLSFLKLSNCMNKINVFNMTTGQNTVKNTYTINATISDYVLTPVSCAWLVNEVMKNLLYQRFQIPYPYAWLKSVVNKKRLSLEEEEKNTSKNFTLNKHYKTVSSAFDSSENIMSNIIGAFTHYGERIKEVIFMLGVTPVSPKEVISVKISLLASGHVERNHMVENSKKQPKVLRTIFLQDTWMNLAETMLPCCNTYVFMKLTGAENVKTHNESIFVPCKAPSFLPSVKCTVINLLHSMAEKKSCCDKLEVFTEFSNPENIEKLHHSHSVQVKEDSCNSDVWLQSTVAIQGFKDCFINKVSATELW